MAQVDLDRAVNARIRIVHAARVADGAPRCDQTHGDSGRCIRGPHRDNEPRLHHLAGDGTEWPMYGDTKEPISAERWPFPQPQTVEHWLPPQISVSAFDAEQCRPGCRATAGSVAEQLRPRRYR